jgi:GTPase
VTNTAFKSGYIAVVGKPNVGKSTLVNALVGDKIAITSPKPQTTRKRVLGILSNEHAQLLFLDTPGIHQPRRALSRYMMREVEGALLDSDVILFVVDVSHPPDDDDRAVVRRITDSTLPKLLALNKADLVDPRHLVANTEAYQALFAEAGGIPPAAPDPNDPRAIFAASDVLLTSAARGDNLDALRSRLIGHLKEGPPYYDPEMVTDQTERVVAAELIREQTLRFLEQEVPHGLAVEIEEWRERNNGMTFIAAVLVAERESQKGILIGRQGRMLKQIGASSRKSIEQELDLKVYLELFVKVRENWREDDRAVERLMTAAMPPEE